MDKDVLGILVTGGFFLASILVVIGYRQTPNKQFKKWAVPVSYIGAAIMLIAFIGSFVHQLFFLFVFPFVFILVFTQTFYFQICVDCGEWIDKDTDWFSKYKRCTKCKTKIKQNI
jgi:hypothetical protein